MVAYVPSVLPDEMLYSLLARTAVHRGVRSAARFMTELFGRPQVVSSFDLPGSLCALADSLGNSAGLGIDSLIDGMTLFPFFTAFVSPASRREVRTGMSGPMSGVHSRLGVTTFRIPPLRTLRFCPTCTAEWEGAGSEWYWRRAHQLSGVMVCPDHGTFLQPSRVSLDLGDRHRFVAASTETCVATEPTRDPRLEEIARDHFLQLAQAAYALLGHPVEAREPDQLVHDYRERMAAVGLMRSACKVDQIALEERFMSFWGETLTYLPRIATEGLPTGGWLKAIVRSPRKSAHPVCHLLLSLFLDSLSEVDRPFGDGPWACRNPLSVHHGELVVKQVVIRRDGSVRYGDFVCGCGYSYTRSFHPDGQIGRPRYRSFGPTLKPALIDMIAAGRSLRSIGERVGLDPKTVVREAAASGIDAPWTAPTPTSSHETEVRSKPRPRLRPGSARRRRHLDWDVIDQRLDAAAEMAISSILAESPVKRVTMVEIERRVASRGWCLKRRKRLPITTRRIAQAQESLSDFRMRRLEHVLSRTASRLDKTPSDVLRECGLPMSWLAVVRTLMSAVIS